MTNERMRMLAIRGAITDLPDEDKVKIEECTHKIHLLIEEYGVPALYAIAQIGANMAANGDPISYGANRK